MTLHQSDHGRLLPKRTWMKQEVVTIVYDLFDIGNYLLRSYQSFSTELLRAPVVVQIGQRRPQPALRFKPSQNEE